VCDGGVKLPNYELISSDISKIFEFLGVIYYSH